MKLQDYHPYEKKLKKIDATQHLFIGFEIEKLQFKIGGIVYDSSDKGVDIPTFSDLFTTLELDSSCGVEAVTNILSLCSRGTKARQIVFDMIDKEADLINSPTDYTCGGHINISMKTASSEDLYRALKRSMPILYGLYENRLYREYTKENKRLLLRHNSKYSPMYCKSNGVVEVRLPSAVKNTKQLKLRYDLMYVIVMKSRPRIKNYSFDNVVKNCMHVMKKMYSGRPERLKEVKKRIYELKDEYEL